MSEAWYDELRRQWKPDAVRLLLVGESAPDPGAEERRFFYAPKLDRRDNLFPRGDRGMYEPIPRGSTGQPKRPWLERLRADGVHLVDSVPFPVDKLTSGERRRARREHVTALVEQGGRWTREGSSFAMRRRLRRPARRSARPACRCCTMPPCRSRWGTHAPGLWRGSGLCFLVPAVRANTRSMSDEHAL
jgi:hypothetical protein